MKTEPDISKLPKWAQAKIRHLEMERDAAVRCLNEFQDSQTPSKMFVDNYPCTGEAQGPSRKRHWIQSETLTVIHAGVELRVSAYGKDCLDLSWGMENIGRDVAFIPCGFQQARLQAQLNQ